MWNHVYKTRDAAVADLEKHDFTWNETAQRFERGERFTSFVVCYLGRSIDGLWIVTRA